MTRIYTVVAVFGLLLLSLTAGCIDFQIDTVLYQPKMGITLHPIDGDFTPLDEYVDELGPSTIRYDISWKQACPSKNGIDEDYVTKMISLSQNYSARDYEQIIVFWQPPEWVQEYPMVAFVDEYLDFLDLFLPYVECQVVQIGNEPNHPYHSPYLVNNINGVPIFFSTAGSHVKEVRPDLKTAANIITISGWSSYMDTMFEDKYEQTYIDILGIDVYPGTWEGGSNPWSDVRSYLNALERDSYDGYDGAIFETGYSTPTIEPFAEDSQERFFNQGVKDLVDLLTGYNYDVDSQSYIRYCILYALENSDGSPSSPEGNFGIIVYGEDNGTIYYQKPSYDEVQYLLSDYHPVILGSGARLPFYGSGLSYTVYIVYTLILVTINFTLAALLYPVASDKNTFWDVEQGAAGLKGRLSKAMAYTSAVSIPLLILGLLPTQSLWALIIIPFVVYYATGRSRAYLALSLVSMLIVGLLYFMLSLWGYFVL